jgi:hypothetical protein
VRWAFIPAAEGVLEILPMETVDGIRCYHFSMTSRTYEFLTSSQGKGPDRGFC